jgi:hypothetical protein
MSSTVRVYVNEKRIATGKVWKGQFLQVFPEKKTFASEAEWRTAIYESLIPTIKFVTTEAKVKKVVPKNSVNEIVRPIPIRPVDIKPAPPVVKPAVKPVLNPESDEEDDDTGNWKCGYCRLPAGNDHRMCICQGYNFSVRAWEEGRIYPKKKRSTTTNGEVSKNPQDWTYLKANKAIFPPGKYYIGDLCYALDDTLYDNVFGPQYRTGYYCMNDNTDHAFMMGDTGGDGEFQGTDGFKYPVDAGIIGIASESTLDADKVPYDSGKMYTFKGNVTMNSKYNKFTFESDNYSDPNITIYIYDDYESA